MAHIAVVGAYGGGGTLATCYDFFEALNSPAYPSRRFSHDSFAYHARVTIERGSYM